jgi:hypothetical protein
MVKMEEALDHANLLEWRMPSAMRNLLDIDIFIVVCCFDSWRRSRL